MKPLKVSGFFGFLNNSFWEVRHVCCVNTISFIDVNYKGVKRVGELTIELILILLSGFRLNNRNVLGVREYVDLRVFLIKGISHTTEFMRHVEVKHWMH